MSDRLHRFGGVSFAGVPMAQYFCDLYLWEVILNEHPDTVAVIELGSWRGGFSLYLQAQCNARGLGFRCYDVIQPEVHVEEFRKLDIFRDKQAIIEHMSRFRGPIVVFCDNGNKPRELREFTRDLPEGSVVVVHDWGTETMPQDVPEWLEETMGELCDEIGSISRVFYVRSEG